MHGEEGGALATAEEAKPATSVVVTMLM